MPKHENLTRDDADAKSRPFIKIDTHQMRAWLCRIGPGELKVWLAYRLRANASGEAWPGLQILSKDTGLSASRISRYRTMLVKHGGLIPLGDATKNHGAGGRWACPKFRVDIPLKHRTAETAHGENTGRRKQSSPCAENDASRTAKTAYEVDVLEVDVSEEECAQTQTHFENPKIPEATRFDGLRKVYLEEFQRKSPNLKPPFEAGDGKMLKSLLNRQPHATVDELAVWLRNAFASDDVPPLRPMFRMREFCSHAEKYANGPLKRVGAPSRAAAVDERQAAQIDGLVIRDGL